VRADVPNVKYYKLDKVLLLPFFSNTFTGYLDYIFKMTTVIGQRWHTRIQNNHSN